MKTLDKILEQHGGWIMACIVFAAFVFIPQELYDYHELLKTFPSIGLGVFGFMLTFIAIILQSDNKTITFIKSRKDLFALFVEYNKRVVYVSAILTITTYLVSTFQIQIDLVVQGIQLDYWAKRIFIALFWGGLMKLGTDLYYFVRSFYVLLKE